MVTTILDPQWHARPSRARRVWQAQPGKGGDRAGAGDDGVSGGAECVRRLTELAEVPASEGRFFDWPAIESDLGLRLPVDYKLLAESFPAGWFRRFVAVRVPERWPDGRVRFLGDFASGQLEAMREFRAAVGACFRIRSSPSPVGCCRGVTSGARGWRSG